ncbi:hypothetical protein [Achromobacter kerstersii]
MSQKLNKIRSEIHALQTEIEEVKRAALDDAGIGAKVDRWLDGMEQRSNRNFTDIVHELAYESKNPGGGIWRGLDERIGLVPDLALSLLVATHRQEFRAMLIKAAKGSVDGRQVADKGAEMKKLAGQLYTLELAEEAEFERLEAGGAAVMRRADANPRAILGFLD